MFADEVNVLHSVDSRGLVEITMGQGTNKARYNQNNTERSRTAARAVESGCGSQRNSDRSKRVCQAVV